MSPPADDAADAALFDELYAELHAIAERVFRSQRAGHTLSPTVLVHEAWLRMAAPGREPAWKDRGHFLAVGARAMRQVLVNHARDRAALKRGGGEARRRVTLREAFTPGGDPVELLDLASALAHLESLDARQGRIAELRLLGGLSLEEIAAATGVSKRTAELDWKMAKQVLSARLAPPGPRES